MANACQSKATHSVPDLDHRRPPRADPSMPPTVQPCPTLSNSTLHRQPSPAHRHANDHERRPFTSHGVQVVP